MDLLETQQQGWALLCYTINRGKQMLWLVHYISLLLVYRRPDEVTNVTSAPGNKFDKLLRFRTD